MPLRVRDAAVDGLTLQGISHRYGSGPVVLGDIDLTIAPGESVALTGPSGSGKTTLLSIMGLLTSPRDGTVFLDNTAVPTGGPERGRLRAEAYAWVFQTVNVLGHRTARDNAALGLLARGVPCVEASRRAEDALEAVGLAEHAAARVVDLSGGELQRVCIARAVASAPRFVLADEPTGQLDHATSERALDALWSARHPDTSIVIATHDGSVACRCDRVIGLVDGRTVEGAR